MTVIRNHTYTELAAGAVQSFELDNESVTLTQTEHGYTVESFADGCRICQDDYDILSDARKHFAAMVRFFKP